MKEKDRNRMNHWQLYRMLMKNNQVAQLELLQEYFDSVKNMAQSPESKKNMG